MTVQEAYNLYIKVFFLPKHLLNNPDLFWNLQCKSLIVALTMQFFHKQDNK